MLRNSLQRLYLSPSLSSTPKTSPSIFDSHNGLGEYLSSPEAYPPSHVINYDEKFVSIHDKYPKSSVHALLLPRDPTRNLLHPFEALEDQVFLADVREHADLLKRFVAGELGRLYGNGGQASERDWMKEVKVGVHAHPSMNHIHIHVLSTDNFSPCMKTRKNYNAFNTPFLVPLDDLPLSDYDPRRHPGRNGYLKSELVCWRCGMEFSFANGMVKLKVHLEEEFEDWKKGKLS